MGRVVALEEKKEKTQWLNQTPQSIVLVSNELGYDRGSLGQEM